MLREQLCRRVHHMLRGDRLQAGARVAGVGHPGRVVAQEAEARAARQI